MFQHNKRWALSHVTYVQPQFRHFWFKPETEAETEVLTRNLEVLQISADTRHQDTWSPRPHHRRINPMMTVVCVCYYIQDDAVGLWLLSTTWWKLSWSETCKTCLRVALSAEWSVTAERTLWLLLIMFRPRRQARLWLRRNLHQLPRSLRPANLQKMTLNRSRLLTVSWQHLALRSRVCVMVQCPSVHLSHLPAAVACGGFAAVGLACRRYWSIAARPAPQQRVAAAWCTAANAGSAAFTANVRSWTQAV